MTKKLTMATKVAAKSGKPDMGKKPSQPITGKLGDGMKAMPSGGDAKKGGPIKTAPSNPIQGKTASKDTAMGCDGVINPFVS